VHEDEKALRLSDLVERLRHEEDPEAANRLGDELGRMVFGT